jgi:hypothetical protein
VDCLLFPFPGLVPLASSPCRIALCLRGAQYREETPDKYRQGEVAPKYSAILSPRAGHIWMRWFWQFTIEHRSLIEKLPSAPPRVYDIIMTNYASPEVQTLKPQSC